MITVAVVEDEARAADLLKQALLRYESESDVKFQITWFRDAELFLTNFKPVYNIVFMDIMLPGMNGMDAARRMRMYDENVSLIFITNMAQFAIKGYEVSAVDFIVKPFKYYDIKMRLDRVCSSFKKETIRINIPIAGGVRTMAADEIYYIESNGHHITYHTKRGNFTARDEPIKNIEEKLVGCGFARCSVGYLVNMAFISEIKGSEVMVGSSVLPISRGRKKSFLAAYEVYANIEL